MIYNMSASFRSAGDSHKLLPSTDRKHLKVSLKHYVVNVEGVQQQNDHIDLMKAAKSLRMQQTMLFWESEQRFLLLQVKELLNLCLTWGFIRSNTTDINKVGICLNINYRWGSVVIIDAPASVTSKPSLSSLTRSSSVNTEGVNSDRRSTRPDSVAPNFLESKSRRQKRNLLK